MTVALRFSSKLKLLSRAAASVLLLVLCALVVDGDDLAAALRRTQLSWFILALALNAVGTILIKAWIAHLTTQASGLRLGFRELVHINLIARFYTIVLPRGVATVVRWKRYRDGGSAHAATALLLFENLLSIATLFFTAGGILSLEASKVAGDIGPVLLPISWLGVAASLAILLPFVHAGSASIFSRILAPLMSRSGRIAQVTKRLLTAIGDYQTLPNRRVGTIFCGSVIGYLFFVLSAWTLAIGMNVGVGLAAIAWVRSVTLLVALIPITVAGLGLREGAFILLLGEYGVDEATGLAYALASFGIQLLLGMVGAILEAMRLLRPAASSEETSKPLS